MSSMRAAASQGICCPDKAARAAHSISIRRRAGVAAINLDGISARVVYFIKNMRNNCEANPNTGTIQLDAKTTARAAIMMIPVGDFQLKSLKLGPSWPRLPL